LTGIDLDREYPWRVNLNVSFIAKPLVAFTLKVPAMNPNVEREFVAVIGSELIVVEHVIV